jgi:hypothetical protein
MEENLINEEQLLRSSAAAAKLNLDTATIRRWRREGAPYHKLGDGLIRYKLSELLTWRVTRFVRKARE